MSDPAHPAPTSNSTPAKSKSGGWLKAGVLGILGLSGGIAGTYVTAVVDRVVKPTKPVANFAVSADGTTLTCDNRATGESGWWDFGDGTPLEPFAPDKPVTHAYAKPGTYSVKLTVRNFLGEENERNVPIDVQVKAPDTTPKITGFAVQPVGGTTAPATFKLTAEVSQADSCVWDLGGGRVEVTPGGKIERLVTFEKPDTFPVSLVAHNGKIGAKESTTIKVEAPRDGTTMVVLKVTDTGNKVERAATTESVAVPVPDKNATAFTKTLGARPGFTITEAVLAGAPASAKNVKVEVAPDRHSVKVSGEWAGDFKATNKAAGGSDALVRVKLTQERVTPQAASVTLVSGTFAVVGQTIRADLPLPPAPLGVSGSKREFAIEVRSVQAGKPTTVAQGPQAGRGPLAFPWAAVQQGQGWTVTYTAKLEGETVVVTAVQGK
ncbi:MAG: PKD domain-containing protein [Gemmata sp.]